MSSFACSLCLQHREFRSFAQLFRHIGVFHGNEPAFQITCNLNQSCGVSYKTYAAYKAHIYRRHSDVLPQRSTASMDFSISGDDDARRNPTASTDSLADDEASNNDDDSLTDLSFLSNGEDAGCTITLSDVQRIYIRFLIQLREEFVLPKKIISSISSNIVSLLDSLESFLQQESVPSTPRTTTTADIQSTKRVIDSKLVTTVIGDISRTIEATTRSEYEFLNLCKRFIDYKAPNEILLSDPGDRPEYGYHIPASQTLSSLFHHPQVLPLVVQNVESHRLSVANDGDLMFSLREGNFGTRFDDESFLIQLYIDDIGLTNPIGPRKDRHKMTMVYFLVEDMPDRFRSQVQNINLLAIGPHQSLKVREIFLFYLLYTVYLHWKDPKKSKRFFQPIIDDMNALQECGFTVNDTLLKFSFSTLSADNLAAHQMGGLQISFASNYFCRRCYLLFNDRSLPSSPSKIAWRTSVDHDHHLQHIRIDPLHRPSFGIIGASVLETLDGYHPMTSLPGDCMHDFLEGYCPLVLMALLKEASASRLITYARVQERMEQFEYGFFDRCDRPPQISTKHFNSDRLAGSAAQKLVLFRLFPLIFSDIAFLLPSIRVYKLLREILELVLAHPFRKGWLPHLRDLCTEFQHSMLDHFPNKMSPKVHFSTEYAQIIEDYGPSTRYWCMRYESRHSYFKQVAVKANNYKNIAHTLATRYQLKHSLFLSKPVLFNNEEKASGMKRLKEFQLSQHLKSRLIASFGLMDMAAGLFECSTLWHNQIQYHQSSVYVSGLEGIEETPLFLQVHRIIRVQMQWMLFIERLRTKCYNEDLCAWEIEAVQDFSLVYPRHLNYFHKGLDVYEINQRTYVSLSSRLTNSNSTHQNNNLIDN